MNVALKVRLGAMMFLQYFVWGSWSVTLGTWLVRGLHFSAHHAGWAAGTTAVGALISPFFVGLVADRWFAVQKLLATLHASGAVLLLVASRQSSFVPLYAAVLVYSICYMPTLSLTNTLAFRQMREPQMQFGPIRMFGTLGWIVAGLMVGGFGMEASARPLQLAAVASFVLGLYCLTLPNTPPLSTGVPFRMGHIIPRAAIDFFRERSMAIFALASFLICIPLQFYYAFANLFLNEIGVTDAAAKMTGGQMSELFCMLLIPWFFRRLGVKYMLGLAMLAWVIRYGLFAYGAPGVTMWMLWAGILLHGICYDFFFVVGQIYIDRRAPETLRVAMQGMMTLITYGAGMFIGAGLSGTLVGIYTTPGLGEHVVHDWHAIWIICAAVAAAILLAFLTTFSEQRAVET